MLLDGSMRAELSSLIGQCRGCFVVFLVALAIHAYKGLVFLVLSIALHIITNLFCSDLSMQQARCRQDHSLFPK